MSMKTVLKGLLSKFASLGSDLEVAMKLDQAVSRNGAMVFADNPEYMDPTLTNSEVKELIAFADEIKVPKPKLKEILSKYGGVLDLAREHKETIKKELIAQAPTKFTKEVIE